jgi:hypothetical protein
VQGAWCGAGLRLGKDKFAMSDICITAAVFTTALVLSKVKRKLLDMADETRNE